MRMKHLTRYCGWLAGCGLLTMGALGAAISVTNTNDSGPGSLRDAIDFANTNGPSTAILFAITPFDSTVKTITPSSALPAITNSVLMDGYTQPGASSNTLANGDNAVLRIELSGAGAGLASGLFIGGGSSTVRGLVINRFSFYGIEIVSPSNSIEGNFIGTDPTGTIGLGNGFEGVTIFDACCNTIGGTLPAARNLISGNTGHGVLTFGGVSTNTVVQGNFIGTDVAGTGFLGNTGDGVAVRGPANCLIGGTAAGARNVISDNSGNGISISGVEGPGGDGTTVQGNLIGTDVTGTNGLGNSTSGVAIDGSAILIGGTTVAARNVISGNGGDGVMMNGSASASLIQGNFIGTDITGARILSNSLSGVFLDGQFGNVINNLVGGVAADAGNLIAGSGSNGVLIVGFSATGNAILGNAIFSNTGLGIDLGGDGVTTNDACDFDTGPNDLQNFPVLVSAFAGANSVTITGSLNSVTNTVYHVEFFVNTTCNPSGFGEGEFFLGSTNLTTDVNCNAPFSVTFPVSVSANEVITATATDPSLNTSEFSPCVSVQSSCVITCPGNITAANSPGQCGAIVSYSAPTTVGSCGTVTCTPSSGSFFSVGTTPVTCTNGNGQGCGFSVQINDTEKPSVTCPPTRTVNADAGQCSASNVSLGSPTTSDNCGVATVVNNAPSTFPVGTNTVTWTVTDVHGNTSTCQQLVIVVDNQQPTITCPATVIANASPGQCSASNVSLGSPVTSDNCGIASVSSNAPASFPVGTNTVTWTVTDAHGNTNSCQQLVIVIDNQPPSITCPSTVSVNADAGQCSASNVSLGAPITSDNCSIASVSSNAPSSFPVGTNTVTWTVTDVHGNTNSCQQLVIVVDNQPPTITCPSTRTVNADAGQCSASNVSLGAPVASDNCGIASVSSNAPASFPVGTNTVTWTVTDVHGNTSTCQQLVIVIDNQPPSITCPPTMTVNTDAGQCLASNVSLGAPTTSDNCGIASVINNAPASFPVGTNTVTWTVTDVHGNTSTCQQLVIVVDSQPPSITCPPAKTISTDPGQCSATNVDLGTPVVSDNCGVAAVTSNAPASFPRGTNTVTWTVTDVHGNTNSCQQLVVVIDLQPPTFGSVSNITKVGTLGTISNAVTFANPTATDSCSTNVSVVFSPHSGSFFPYGTNTVNVTATDPSGNSASTNFLVIVILPTGPDLTGAPLTTPPTNSDTNGWVAGISGTFPLPSGGTRRLILGAFDVLNAGSNAASAFVVQFYLADQPTAVLTPSNQLPFATANVSSLAPSKIKHLVFAVIPPSSSSLTGKYLIAKVDAQKQVPETDELNNVFFFQLGPEIAGSASVRTFHKLVRDQRTRARRAARAGGP